MKLAHRFAFLSSSLLLSQVPAVAAEISISTTAPSVDALDVANLAAGTSTQKWFDDVEHDAGQTFTPTSDGLLRSFTIYLAHGNLNDGGSENVDVRFGTVTRPGGEFTFTDVYTENAAMADSPEGDWAANDYITFTFDTPQPVSAGVEYGIITDAKSMGNWRSPAEGGGGIPYRHRTGNLYEGGSMINRGGESTNADLVFHANIEPAVAAAPFAITEIDYAPEATPNPTVTLTWRKTAASTYVAYLTRDLSDWGEDLDDSITVDRDERPEDTEQMTVTFPLENERATAPTLLFRIEEG